jgi:hypothetical protein
VFAIVDVWDTAAPIALDCPGAVHRDGGAAEAIHYAGIDGDDVAGAAKSIARAECVAHRNAFHASAEAGGQVPYSGNGVGKTAAEKLGR